MNGPVAGITRRAFALEAAAGVAAGAANQHYPGGRSPLAQTPFIPLPLGAVRAKGFLQEQLRRLGDGLTGRLDEHYPLILGPRNGWLGGDGDCGEKAPYWLDGLVPLAHLLDDGRLLEKSRRWVNAILASQRPDGSFGPVATPGEKPRPEGVWPDNLQKGAKGDWWTRMPILKALQSHHEATGDARIPEFMGRYFRHQFQRLPAEPLDHFSRWGRDRAGENLASIFWLYSRTGDAFLLDAAKRVFEQSTDWTTFFLSGLLAQPTREVLDRREAGSRALPLAAERDLLAGRIRDFHYNGLTHGVNLAMALKQPAVFYQLSRDTRHLEATRRALADLTTFHGMANGMYSCDEWLHGTNPTQGIELCAVVEMMASLETLLAITGTVEFADRLERIAYNALPAQMTSDLRTRQYFQQANQIRCNSHPRNFQTDAQRTDDLRFGLVTGYVCCTFNAGQGWPKLIQNLWLASSDNGLAALVYGPCEVTARVADGATVTIVEETGYPFDETVNLTMTLPRPAGFPLHLRVPGWCRNATVRINAEAARPCAAGEVVRLDRLWKNRDVVRLHLPMEIRFSRWHDASVAVEHGPLVYALKMEEKWRQVGERHGVPVWDVESESVWNYGLMAKEGGFRVTRRAIAPQPWTQEDAPVVIEAKGRRIPHWQEYSAMAGPLPGSSRPVATSEPAKPLTLIPYGCTRLRISQFPETHTNGDAGVEM